MRMLHPDSTHCGICGESIHDIVAGALRETPVQAAIKVPAEACDPDIHALARQPVARHIDGITVRQRSNRSCHAPVMWRWVCNVLQSSMLSIYDHDP